MRVRNTGALRQGSEWCCHGMGKHQLNSPIIQSMQAVRVLLLQQIRASIIPVGLWMRKDKTGLEVPRLWTLRAAHVLPQFPLGWPWRCV